MLGRDFDPDRKAVINPEELHGPTPGFPALCIGLFSKPMVDELAERYAVEVLCQAEFCTGNVPVYRVRKGDREAALFLPHVGAAVASGFIEDLWAEDGRAFVFAGSAGALRRELTEGHLVVPTAAVRDEGTSYHYLPPAEEVEIDPACVAACTGALEALGLPFVTGKTWTTDGFYRETRGLVERRKGEGCLTVEMECAALAAVAQFRGVRFAQFLVTADNLDAPAWDARTLDEGRWADSLAEKCFAAALETGARMLKL